MPDVKGRFLRPRGSRFFLGPVEDFAAFCKQMDFGNQIERQCARILKFSADPEKYFLKAGGIRIEVVNEEAVTKQYSEISRQVHDNHREFPWFNLHLLTKLAIKSSNPNWSANCGAKNGKLVAANVWDFDAFCKKVDFAEIVERNDETRTLKLRVSFDQLTGDAVASRVGSDVNLEQYDRERLGLVPNGRTARRQSANSGSVRANFGPPPRPSAKTDVTSIDCTSEGCLSGVRLRRH